MSALAIASASAGVGCTMPGGTGLGLAIAQRLAQAHGGHIELYAEDGATVVRVSLPLAAERHDLSLSS